MASLVWARPGAVLVYGLEGVLPVGAAMEETARRTLPVRIVLVAASSSESESVTQTAAATSGGAPGACVVGDVDAVRSVECESVYGGDGVWVRHDYAHTHAI